MINLWSRLGTSTTMKAPTPESTSNWASYETPAYLYSTCACGVVTECGPDEVLCSMAGQEMLLPVNLHHGGKV